MTREPELSARALFSGAVVGALLGVCNTYMGLRIGWFDTGSLTAALVGFALLRLFRQSPSPHEHNVLQTFASSVATMPSTAGLLAAIPALTALGVATSTPSLLIWASALGLWGVLLAMPMRRRLLEEEALPFPTGVATAELISSVQKSGDVARTRGTFFVVAALSAAAVTWLRDGRPAIIPADWVVGVALGGLAAEVTVFGVAVSAMTLGAGLMTGARVGLSLLFGALAMRLGLAPWLHQHGWVGASAEDVNAWLVWPGVGLMVGASVPAVLTLVREAPAGLRALRGSTGGGRMLVLGGAACIIAAGGVAMWWGARPLPILIGFALSLPLVAVSNRAAGQTDIAPLAPLGQLTQVAAAMLGPGAISTVAAGAVPAGSGAQSANTLWTMRAGRILKADDGPQLKAQALGAVLGALVCVPVYQVLVARYQPGSEQLPAPWVAQWKAIAELLATGGQALPSGAGVALGVALVLGALLAAVEDRFPDLAPSPLALGLSCLLPMPAVATLALGGVLAFGLERRRAGWMTEVGLPVAAGLISGESVVAVLAIALQALGIFG